MDERESRSGQYAYEVEGARHALFTCALLDALRNGDKNGNGVIELSELVAYVQDRVPKLAAQAGGTGRSFTAVSTRIEVSQTPRFGSRSEDFALVRRLQWVDDLRRPACARSQKCYKRHQSADDL